MRQRKQKLGRETLLQAPIFFANGLVEYTSAKFPEKKSSLIEETSSLSCTKAKKILEKMKMEHRNTSQKTGRELLVLAPLLSTTAVVPISGTKQCGTA